MFIIFCALSDASNKEFISNKANEEIAESQKIKILRLHFFFIGPHEIDSLGLLVLSGIFFVYFWQHSHAQHGNELSRIKLSLMA